jgi:hypothetical protein
MAFGRQVNACHFAVISYDAARRTCTIDTPPGNLFLLLTLPKMRRQGLIYLSFYALQRTVKEREILEVLLRRETGLADYEVSRACKFPAKSGLVEARKADHDKRVRVLTPAVRGRGVVERL